MIDVSMTYHGSNGANTTKLLKALRGLGPLGCIAAALFTAQKASARAKVYRGGMDKGKDKTFVSYRQMAYDKKAESLKMLSSLLNDDANGLVWGWGRDGTAPFNSPADVVYVELPTGQVSFHSFARYSGPDFPGQWDCVRGVSDQRVIDFCQRMLESHDRSLFREDTQYEPSSVAPF